MTFSVASLDAGQPGKVGPLLVALRAATIANVEGRVQRDAPALVPGMTPHAAARVQLTTGGVNKGQSVVVHHLEFSYGTRVYQAIALGAAVDQDIARRFVDGLAVAK